MNTTGQAPKLNRDERRELTAAMKQAALGIAAALEIMCVVNDRTGYEWSPSHTSCSEIADTLSSEHDPRRLTQRDVLEHFNDPADWDAPAPLVSKPEDFNEALEAAS